MPPAAPKYIRNVRYVPVSLRLGTGRRIELKPRGMRGDCAPVSKDEMNDEIFLGNKGLLFEVIPGAEAKEVIAKQTTNQQSAHPALKQIRNAKGEELTRSGVVFEESNVEKGKFAATVSERGEITRFKAPGAEDVRLPDAPQGLSDEEYADWVARQKNIEGPEAGLAGLKLVKEEVQTTPKEN